MTERRLIIWKQRRRYERVRTVRSVFCPHLHVQRHSSQLTCQPGQLASLWISGRTRVCICSVRGGLSYPRNEHRNPILGNVSPTLDRRSY